jgi:hypothetical protein
MKSEPQGKSLRDFFPSCRGLRAGMLSRVVEITRITFIIGGIISYERSEYVRMKRDCASSVGK